MNKSNNGYVTKDIYIASYLLAENCNLIDAEQDHAKSFVWFIFSDYGRCKELEEKFFNKKGLVEPNAFLYSMNLLKQKIFQITSQSQRGA